MKLEYENNIFCGLKRMNSGTHKPDLSPIITNWNRHGFIVACIVADESLPYVHIEKKNCILLCPHNYIHIRNLQIYDICFIFAL